MPCELHTPRGSHPYPPLWERWPWSCIAHHLCDYWVPAPPGWERSWGSGPRGPPGPSLAPPRPPRPPGLLGGGRNKRASEAHCVVCPRPGCGGNWDPHGAAPSPPRPVTADVSLGGRQSCICVVQCRVLAQCALVNDHTEEQAQLPSPVTL